MPARPTNNSHPTGNVASIQVCAQLALLAPHDMEALIGEHGAQGAGVALQSSVSHMTSMRSSISISPAQPTPPPAAARVPSAAENFESP